MKKNKIFVACDTSNLTKIKKIINHTRTNKLKIIPKFGLQFFYSKGGRKFIENYKSDFFLDIKASDIPQTITSALNSIKDLKNGDVLLVAGKGHENYQIIKNKRIPFSDKKTILDRLS